MPPLKESGFGGAGEGGGERDQTFQDELFFSWIVTLVAGGRLARRPMDDSPSGAEALRWGRGLTCPVVSPAGLTAPARTHLEGLRRLD